MGRPNARSTSSLDMPFRKTDVQNVDKQFGRSLMPGYKDKLSAAETDDLVAYLASLGARK